MNLRTSLSTCSILCMGLIAAPFSVHAASVDIEVTAALTDGCAFSVASLGTIHSMHLGMVHPLSSSLFSATKTFQYRCSAGTGYTISIPGDTVPTALRGVGQSPRSMSLAVAKGDPVPTQPQQAVFPYTLHWTAPSDLTGGGLDATSMEHEVKLEAKITPSDTAGKLPGIYKDSIRLTIMPGQ